MKSSTPSFLTKSSSPDKLDSLLMMIDEMGIRLIDEADIGEFQAKPRGRKNAVVAPADAGVSPALLKAVEDEEEIDLNLEKETRRSQHQAH